MKITPALLGIGLCLWLFAQAEPEDKTPAYDNATRVLDGWQPKWIRDKYFDGRENPTHGKSKKSHAK